MHLDKHKRPLVISLLALLASTACGGPLAATGSSNTTPASCDAAIEVRVDDQVNPSAEGLSLPVVLRLYQLRDAKSFLSAAFDDLWLRDATTLAQDLLGTAEHTFYPGDERIARIALVPDARVIAAVALFREPAGASWKAAVTVSPDRLRQCVVEGRPLDRLYLALRDTSLMASVQP